MDRDALIKDVKGLLRRSIASTLNVTMADYDTSRETRTVINRWLAVVMTIGCNETLDGAINELCEKASFFGVNTIPRRIVRAEVEACCNIFRFEVAAFTRVHEMNRCEMEPGDIWNHLVSVVRIPRANQNDWLEQSNARWSRSQDSENFSENPLNFAQPCLAA